MSGSFSNLSYLYVRKDKIFSFFSPISKYFQSWPYCVSGTFRLPSFYLKVALQVEIAFGGRSHPKVA